jgi:hypothetical protein
MVEKDGTPETQAENHWISKGDGTYQIPVSSGIAV